MKTAENIKILDDKSISFLEEVGTTNTLPNLDLEKDVMNQAEQLNINLKDLENEADVSGLLVTPSEVLDDEINEEDTLREAEDFMEYAEVSLKDITAKLLDGLDRPAAVICDDKIRYVNKIMLELLETSNEKVVGENLLDFVREDEWNLLAENIGVMLTDSRSIDIHFKTLNGNDVPADLEAIYLPDDKHFAFILMGRARMKPEQSTADVIPNGNLYDPLTGLPNFYLFEDRVHVAVNDEAVKNNKTLVAVVGISIDNIAALRQIGMEEFVLKKLASKLVFTLKKKYTIARGLKYQFWILLGGINDLKELDKEIKQIKTVFDAGVEDNFAVHQIITSIGVSAYPAIAKSGKRLLDQVINAIKTAQEQNGGVSLFDDQTQAPK